jgi:hypothetical protein
MRFYVKLLVMVAIGVGMQWFIQRNEQELDEAQFAARCFIGHLCGRENSDAELMDAATALKSRQVRRLLRGTTVVTVVAAAAEPRATTRPAEVRAASVAADALESSLACAGACDAGR